MQSKFLRKNDGFEYAAAYPVGTDVIGWFNLWNPQTAATDLNWTMSWAQGDTTSLAPKEMEPCVSQTQTVLGDDLVTSSTTRGHFLNLIHPIHVPYTAFPSEITMYSSGRHSLGLSLLTS